MNQLHMKFEFKASSAAIIAAFIGAQSDLIEPVFAQSASPSVVDPGCMVRTDANGAQYGFIAPDGLEPVVVDSRCAGAKAGKHTYKSYAYPAQNMMVLKTDVGTYCYDTSAGATKVIPQISCPAGQTSNLRRR